MEDGLVYKHYSVGVGLILCLSGSPVAQTMYSPLLGQSRSIPPFPGNSLPGVAEGINTHTACNKQYGSMKCKRQIKQRNMDRPLLQSSPLLLPGLGTASPPPTLNIHPGGTGLWRQGSCVAVKNRPTSLSSDYEQ